MDEPYAQEPAAPDATRPAWFRQVTFHSLLAGLCPLIPIPFLDDRVLAGVRRKMVRDLAAERGWSGDRALDRHRVDVLAGTRSESRGCLGWVGWIAFSLTLRLLAKLFRKILILFAVKESVDTASRVFHEGYLLHLTFAWAPSWGSQPDGKGDDDGPTAGLSPARARAVRRTIEATLNQVDPRPLEQVLRRTFRGSRRLLRRGARVLTRRGATGAGRTDRPGRRARGERPLPEDEERRLLGRVLDRLVADLWEERGYLNALEQRYREELAAPASDPGTASIATADATSPSGADPDSDPTAPPPDDPPRAG